jgi:uncharacterized protein (TIGR02466 family)
LENAADTSKAAGSTVPETAGGPAGARIDWFPTSIWRFNVVDHQMLNQKLMQLIEEERRRDPAGLGGRSTRLGWHSTDRLHDHPGMQEFVGILHENVAEVVRAYRVDTTKVAVKLATCWAIVNGKLASGVIHCHPNSFLSGVYYVNTNDDSGDIFFQDPRHVASMWSCPVTEYTPWTIRQVSYRPAPGGMLIFPSWLHHGVEPNLSDDLRVSLSFNFLLHWVSRP